MEASASEVSEGMGLSNKTCPSCSTAMEDLGDRFECPSCKYTLMKGDNPL